jgi:hypothetical protein
MKMQQTQWTFNSEKYGVFYINRYNQRKYGVWWDYYDEMEGCMIEPGVIEQEIEFWKECDVRDFSDLPKNGDFKSLKETIEYLEKKFGEKIKLEE